MRLLTPIRRFVQPTQAEVEKFVGIAPDMSYADKKPSMEAEEWNKNHKDFILRYWLPLLFYNPLGNTLNELKIWRITVEAYLSGAELRSNGSTAVRDLRVCGRIKDPFGVAHDFVFELNMLGWADAFGHKWGLFEANRMYRDFMYACRYYFVGFLRWCGLQAVSFFPWNLGTEQGKFRLAPTIKGAIYDVRNSMRTSH